MKRLATIALLFASLPAWAADYSILAPAAPGGGWDQTARTMQTLMQKEGIAGNVQVTNVPGAGGTIGLAQFVNQAKGDPEDLIVGGYVMVGAILTNASPVDLTMVTPIARLTGESEAIVVPAASDIQTMDDLIGLIAKAVGVDVALENWRMVAAAPGLSDEQKAAVAADIETLATPDAWRAELEPRGWDDRYLAGADFEKQLAADIEATRGVLTEIGLVQ